MRGIFMPEKCLVLIECRCWRFQQDARVEASQYPGIVRGEPRRMRTVRRLRPTQGREGRSCGSQREARKVVRGGSWDGTGFVRERRVLHQIDGFLQVAQTVIARQVLRAEDQQQTESEEKKGNGKRRPERARKSVRRIHRRFSAAPLRMPTTCRAFSCRRGAWRSWASTWI